MKYKIVISNGRLSLEKQVDSFLQQNHDFVAVGAPFYETGYWCQAVQKKSVDKPNHESRLDEPVGGTKASDVK